MVNIIELPKPQIDLDFPLMKALEARRTNRKWKDDTISLQDTANLLWAACGITKAPKGKGKSRRTAPSACNSQEIRVYTLQPDGVFLYNEDLHLLKQVVDQDIRKFVGTQKMMHSAPLGLVFVADLNRMNGPLFRSNEARKFCAWVDTGYISQNIYLYCAAAGLATAVLALIKRNELRSLMNLSKDEKIVLTQVVGYAL